MRAIGIVISALADISGGKKKKDQAFVPYRDSTLTWLLKVGADCSEPLPYTLVSSPCWLGQLGRQQQDSDGGYSQPCLRQLRRVAQHVAVTRAPCFSSQPVSLVRYRYADRAKRIVNHAIVNEDPSAKIIRQLKEEVERLRDQLGGRTGFGLL